MAVQVNPNRTVRVGGVRYKAGQVIQTLDADVKAELLKVHAIKDLDNDVNEAKNVAADINKVKTEVDDDAPIVDQIKAAVAKDLEANEALAKTPGKIVQAGKKFVNALAGDKQTETETPPPPADPVATTPPAPVDGQPSNEEVANTAAQVS